TTLTQYNPHQHNTNLSDSAVSDDHYTNAIICAHHDIPSNCLSATANTTLTQYNPHQHNTNLSDSAVSDGKSVK
ncbi:MAG: hypothetical protein P8X83_08520, partial [Nitrosopumilaceae archaeon]